MPTITEIVEENFKTGVSQKTGKEWAMHKFRLDDGQEITAFSSLEIGDEVEMTEKEYNGKVYQNWNKVGAGGDKGSSGPRPQAGGKTTDEIWAQNAEIIKRLERIESYQLSLARQLKLKHPQEEIDSQAEELTADNLGDIPF